MSDHDEEYENYDEYEGDEEGEYSEEDDSQYEYTEESQDQEEEMEPPGVYPEDIPSYTPPKNAGPPPSQELQSTVTQAFRTPGLGPAILQKPEILDKLGPVSRGPATSVPQAGPAPRAVTSTAPGRTFTTVRPATQPQGLARGFSKAPKPATMKAPPRPSSSLQKVTTKAFRTPAKAVKQIVKRLPFRR